MGYEILAEDLFDDSKKKKPKKDKSSSKSDKGSKKLDINPLFIHIGLILVILILLFFVFSDSINFNFKDDKVEDITVLVGELNSFNKIYSGDLELYVSNSELKTQSSTLELKSQDLEIKDFQGNIYLDDNDSIVLNGTAEKIVYGKNILNLENTQFTLTSFDKTNANLYYEKIDLDFKEGRIKLNEELNYEFTNSSITLNRYNMSFNYDGTFTFSGISSEFTLNASSPKLMITYKNE
ncbi:MAG: hypothetical protein PF569_00100 [Candidatus Woesearchaeota archaeon]|jgi:hypothetical protein|nr:hypothetical protein [Candidatus Woesearchaeota archaeon]